MHVIEASFKQRRESKTKRNDLLDMMIDAVEGSLDNVEDDDVHASDLFEKDAPNTVANFNIASSLVYSVFIV